MPSTPLRDRAVVPTPRPTPPTPASAAAVAPVVCPNGRRDPLATNTGPSTDRGLESQGRPHTRPTPGQRGLHINFRIGLLALRLEPSLPAPAPTCSSGPTYERRRRDHPKTRDASTLPSPGPCDPARSIGRPQRRRQRAPRRCLRLRRATSTDDLPAPPPRRLFDPRPTTPVNRPTRVPRRPVFPEAPARSRPASHPVAGAVALRVGRRPRRVDEWPGRGRQNHVSCHHLACRPFTTPTHPPPARQWRPPAPSTRSPGTTAPTSLLQPPPLGTNARLPVPQGRRRARRGAPAGPSRISVSKTTSNRYSR